MQLKALENLRELSGNDSVSKVEKAYIYIYYILKLAGEFLIKTVMMASTMLVVIVKIIMIRVLSLISPLITLISIFVDRLKNFNSWFLDWAAKDSFFGLVYTRRIWEELLQFAAPAELMSSVSMYFAKYKKTSDYTEKTWKLWAGRILRGLFTPFVIGYQFLRFLISIIGSLIGRLGVAFMNFVALIAIFIWSLTGIILMPAVMPLVNLFEIGFEKINVAYPKAIRWSLNNSGTVIGSSAGLFLFAWFVLMPTLGNELIPEVHQGEFDVDIYLPVGTRLEETDRVLKVVESKISGYEMISELATVVGAEKSANLKSDEGEHTGKVTVRMGSEYIGAENETALIQNIRQDLSKIPGIVTKISRQALFSFKTPVEVQVKGYDLTVLKRTAFIVEGKLSEITGLTDVKSNIQTGNPEVQIIYNRKLLAKYGLNIFDVASIVRNKVKGEVASRFKDEERRIDILVRINESDKESIDDLHRLIINPGNPIPIRLAAVANIKIGEGPSEIRRVDQQRVALITANTTGIDLGTAMLSISDVLDELSWPRGFSYTLSGQNKEMETSMDSLIFALILAVFLVYVVMASQFESLIHPFVIMFTIPLALIGVVFILWLLSVPLSVVVFLGLIMLAGIVVNNAIVLVDYINRLRANGMNKIDAIVTAGSVRLRPILMTTATTVLGLLPMALGLGEGAEIRTPMAITVVAGLISSTVLTLLVIPTVYALVDRKD